jgi:ketosteroid isomerase-like protein
MSTSANLDLVRSLYAARGRGDYSSDEWADDDLEYVIVDGPTPGAWRGRSAVAQVVRDFLSAWENFRDEPEEFRELDAERVLVLHHFTGRGKASGLDVGQMSAKTASVFHLRNGKVQRIVVCFDRERALADLGLAPEGDAP